MKFQEKQFKSSQIVRKLLSFFEKGTIDRIAKEKKFVQRNSELTGIGFVQMCISSVTEKGQMETLNEMCSILLKQNIKIREQSLHERFNDQAVELLKSIFEKAIDTRFDETTLKILEIFSCILLEDSTTIALPENLKNIFQGCGGVTSKAALKIDYTYDLKTTNFSFQLHSARKADSSILLPDQLKKKSLWLRDLGYFKMNDFEKINQAEAFYVSRLKGKVNLYLTKEKDAEPLDILGILKKMKENEVKDVKVFIGKKKRLETRLILQKVPKEVGGKKRRKLKYNNKRKCKKVSEYRLALCDAAAYITNINQEDMTAYDVMKIYKVRWQIEILFKVWKSILKIGLVQKMKANRFLCLLYSQLIWAIINMNIFQSFKNHFWNEFKIEISEIKTFKILRLQNHDLIKAILKNCKNLYIKYFDYLHEAISRLGKKQYKKGNPNPLFCVP